MRCLCDVLRIGTVILLLAGRDGFSQAGPPRTAAQNEESTILRDLQELIAQLQRAVQANNLDEAYAVTGRIQVALGKARETPRSLSKIIEDAEKDLVNYPSMRRTFLGRLSYLVYRQGDRLKAARYAEEALGISGQEPGFSGQESRFAPEQLYYAHNVLGMVALDDEDKGKAKYHLLASVEQSWSSMSSLGPNVTLAKRLLERGERDVVIDFFERCKKIWPGLVKTLALWQAIIRNDAIPNFGSHLEYY